MTTQKPPSPTAAAGGGAVPIVVPDFAYQGAERGLQFFLIDNEERLRRFALLRLANDADAAAEVVRATIAEAFRTVNGIHAEAAPETPVLLWLFRICRLEVEEYQHQ